MSIEISETLATLRSKEGLTQEEVARHLGVTKAAVSKWECGQSMPDISLLPALASLYSTTVDDLLGCSHELDEGSINEIYLKSLALLGEDYRTGYDYICSQAREHWGCPELLRLLGAALLTQIPQLEGFSDGSLEGDSLACAKEAERIVRRTMELTSEEDAYLIELPALTRILMWTGRQSEAEALLEGRVKKEPNLDAALLAQLQVEAGRKEEGIAVLQRALLVSLVEAQSTMASMAPLVDADALSDLVQLASGLQSDNELVSLFPTLMPVLRIQQAKNYAKSGHLEEAIESLDLFAADLDKACGAMENPVNPALFDKVKEMLWADGDDVISEARSESVDQLRSAYVSSLASDETWEPLREDARFDRIVAMVSNKG